MRKLMELLAIVVPFLEPYPIWLKVLISGWVVVTAVIVIGLVFARPRVPTEPSSQGVASQQAPGTALRRSSSEILTATTIEALRGKNGVRELQTLENDLSIHRLPGRVYGFTVPWIINTNPTGVVGGTGLDRISLQHTSGGTVVMEVHKTDRDVFVVGYVSESDLIRLRDPSRRNEAEVALFFAPFREFSAVVAIPLRRIQKSEKRRVENQYVNDLEVL